MSKKVTIYREPTTAGQSAVTVAVGEGLEYHGEWMGDCYVTVTVKSATAVDFQVGDYLEYRGERYTIQNVPTVVKKSSSGTYGEGFVYDNIRLESRGYELKLVDFCDYVIADNLVHFSSLGTFSFFASTVSDLCDRIKANLDRIYTGANEWTVVCGSMSGETDALGNEVVRDQNVAVDKLSVWDALQLVKKQFGTTFRIIGRTIYVGTSAGLPTISGSMTYGKGNGLYEVERVSDNDQYLLTRLKVYGSDKNLPNNYYYNLGASVHYNVTRILSNIDTELDNTLILLIDNDIFGGVFTEISSAPRDANTAYYRCGVTINGVSTTGRVEVFRGSTGVVTHLVLSTGYYSTNEELAALRATGEIVNKTVYFTSGVNKTNVPGEHITYNNSIPGALSATLLMLPGYPAQSLQAWWNAYKVSAGRDTDFVSKVQAFLDSGYTLSNEQYAPYIISPHTSDYGVREGSWYFDGSDNAHQEICPTVTGMTRDNVILNEVSAGSQVTDNGVLGNIEKAPTFTMSIPYLGFSLRGYLNSDTYIALNSGMCGGRKFKITGCSDGLSAHTLTCERSYDESIGKWFPYVDYNIAQNDTFVLLGIELPQEYVESASRRALLAGLYTLSQNDAPRYTYKPKIDEIQVQRERDGHQNVQDSVYYKLREGLLLTFADTDLGINVSREISVLTIKEDGNNGLPTFDVTLKDDDDEGEFAKLFERVDYLESGATPDNSGTISGNNTGTSEIGGDSIWEVITDEETGEQSAHLKSQYKGAWTEGFLSALGLNPSNTGSGGGGGGVILNEPLESINNASLGLPTVANTAIIWNGSAFVWGNTGHNGTVTSVGMSVPTGFKVSGSPITTSGTLSLAFENGYSLPTTAKQGQWDEAYVSKHTHSNKSVLDGITSAKISNWDTVYGATWWGRPLVNGVVSGNMTNVGSITMSGDTTHQSTTLERGVLPSSRTVMSRSWKDKNGKNLGWFEYVANTSDGGGNSHVGLFILNQTTGENNDYGGLIIRKTVGETGNKYLTFDANTGLLTSDYVKTNRLYLYKPNAGNDTGAVYIEYNSQSSGVHLVGAGLYTESYLSALGLNAMQSSGGIDVTALWDEMADNGNEQIALNHLTTALNGYATKEWVNQQGFLTSYSEQYTGTVTSITAGTGLSGGTITGSGTIGISSTYQSYISHGETAYGWGNHATAGYMTTNTGDSRYVKVEFFNKLFQALNGTTAVNVNADSVIDNLKIKVGAWTEQYLSALGLNSSNSASGGLDVQDVIDILTGTQYSYTLNAAHLPNIAWSDITGKPSTFAPSAHNHNELYVTALGVSGDYVTWTKNGSTNNITVPYATKTVRLAQSTLANDGNLNTFTHNTDLIYAAKGGSNTVSNKPDGVTAFGNVTMKIADLWNGQVLIGTNNSMYFRVFGTYNNVETFYDWNMLLTDKNYTSYVYTKSEIDNKLAAKLDVAFFDALFQAYAGSNKVTPNASTSSVDNIRAMFGFWTEQYLSALGQNGSTSSVTGIDWASLITYDNNSDHVINVNYLPNIPYSKLTGVAAALHDHDSRYYISGGTIHLGSNSITPLTSYTEQYRGTVTSVATGTGLSGGPITSSGTISISSAYQTYISNGNTAYGWGNHATAGYLLATTAASTYLPLTIPSDGKTINAYSINGTITIKNVSSNYPLIRFEGNTAGGIGFLGIGKTGDVVHPYFVTADSNGGYTDGVSAWNILWHAGNDGDGSGLDADKLDGQHATYFAKASDVTTLQGYFTDGVANEAAKLHTKRKLWGNDFDGTADVSGNITIKKSTTISANDSAQLILSVTQSDNNITSQGFIKVYDDHDAYSYGTNMVIQSSGNMIIGGGESPSNLYSEILTGSTAENLFLTADGSIYFEANANTIGSRKGMMLTTAQALVPTIAGVSSNNTGTIGTASYRWNTVYCTQVNIGGVRIYHDGTGLRVEGGLAADTYISALGVNATQSGGGGMDVTALWEELGGNTTTKIIGSSHLPTASSSALGGVKVGTTLAISNGVLNQKSGIATAGTYSKVTVDTYGRVTAGTTLAGSDIPSISATKIAFDKLDAARIPDLSGTYLPLTLPNGGKTVSMSGVNSALTIKNTSSDYPLIRFEGKTAGGIGFIGIGKTNDTIHPYFVSADSNGEYTENVSAWNIIWHAGNDGDGSGLDADLLDGQHASAFASASAVTTLQGYFTNGVANVAARLSAVSKTAWGQTYWTSGGVPQDVSGNMTGVGSLTMTGQLTMWAGATDSHDFKIGWVDDGTGNDVLTMWAYEGSYYDMCLGTYADSVVYGGLYFDASAWSWGIGTANPYCKMDVNGGVKAGKFYLYKPNAGNDTGAVYLTYDAGNGGVHVVGGGLYADTFLSALGVNAAVSGGGVDAQAVIDILTGTEYQYTLNVAHLPVHDHDSRYYISGGTIHLGGNSITPLTSYTETDPTVPAWAKASTKPSYTLDEVSDGSTRKLSDYVTLGTTQTITGTKTITGQLMMTGAYMQNLVIDSAYATNGNTCIQFKHTTSGTSSAYGGICMSEVNGSLKRYTSAWNYYTVWDSGNDGTGSGLDADLLDGKHSTDFVTRAGFFRNSNTSATVTPSEIILPLTNAAYDIWELDLSGASVSYATSAGSAGTATTASKLSTVSKTIWGQTYWTSGGVPDNVDGKMTINYTGSSASELITLKAPNASYNCISYNKVGTNGLNWSVGINASSYYFWNSSNGTVVSIANAGNLGVGTTNPGYKLDVNGTGRFVSGVISNNSIQSDGDLYMTSQNARILMDYDSVLELNGTSSALMVGYGTTAYSNFTTEIYGGKLDFCTGLTSRMYIDEYGCVGINTYYPQGYTLNVNGTTLLDGLVTANKNIEVLNNGSTASAYVKIGGRKITYDSTNGALFVDGNLYATGGISALGYMQITDAGLAGSLIPTTSNAYDIGSASKSLRKMYSNAVTVWEHLGVGGDAGNNYAMYVNVEDDEGVLLPCWFDCPVTVSGGLNMNTGTVGTAGSSSDTNGTIILTVNGGVKAKKFWLDGSRYLYLDGTTLKYYNGSASKTVVLS